MTKYRTMKKAYDKWVVKRRSGFHTPAEIYAARLEFKAAALELFPQAGARAEGAARDLIKYYSSIYYYSKRK